MRGHIFGTQVIKASADAMKDRCSGLSHFWLSPGDRTRRMSSIHPGLYRVLLDEAPSSEEYRTPHSEFENEYLSYYAQAVATYRKRPPSAADYAAGRVILDAIHGVIYNAARRGNIEDLAMQSELVRLVSLYLGDDRRT